MELVKINSFVRGYHDYFDIWDAVLILRESLTTVETFMQYIAVLSEGQGVGHSTRDLLKLMVPESTGWLGYGMEITDCMDLKYAVTN